MAMGEGSHKLPVRANTYRWRIFSQSPRYRFSAGILTSVSMVICL